MYKSAIHERTFMDERFQLVAFSKNIKDKGMSAFSWKLLSETGDFGKAAKNEVRRNE